MRYLGGKSRTAKQIGAFLRSLHKPGQTYLEPFVGAGWVLAQMDGIDGDRIASDANPYLIAMYRCLQQGWRPPTEISEEEYKAIKEIESDIPEYMALKAFVGFGCSFAGKWFAGYCRDAQKNNYAARASRSLLKRWVAMESTRFLCCNYTDHEPDGYLVYCDPPYASTTEYAATDRFDTDKFWSVMRRWSGNNTVVVSEYSAPPDFTCVLEMKTATALRDSDNKTIPRTERLFMYFGG